MTLDLAVTMILDANTKGGSMKEIIGNLDVIKLYERYVKNAKRRCTDWEKIQNTYLLSEIYKEHL